MVATQLATPDIFRPTRCHDYNSVGCSQLLSPNSMPRSQLSWLLPTSFVQLVDTVTLQLDAPDTFRPTRCHDYNSVGCSRHLSSNSRPPSQLSWLLPTSFVQLVAAIATQLATPDIFRPTRCHDYNSVGCSQLLSSNSVTRSQLSWILPTPFVQLGDTIATRLDAPNFFRPTRGRHRNSVGYSGHLSSNSVTRSQHSWMLPTSFVQLENRITLQLATPNFFRPTRGRHHNSVGCSQLLSSNSRTPSQLQLATPNFFRPTR
jgi:hypothetical protein